MLASIWTVGGYGATQVIRLANSIVLSYFLAPDAFGIMALINIFLQGLIMSSDIGVGPSIIQHDAGEDPRFLARRMVIFAAEDIGLADPRALQVAVSAAEAFDREIGRAHV